MLFKLISVLLFLSSPVFLFAELTPLKKIQNLILLDCPQKAKEEAMSFLKQNPHDPAAWEITIEALGKNGDIAPMVYTWKEYLKAFSLQPNNRKILENMAWAVLQKESTSPSFLIRAFVTIGAALSQDQKGIEQLKKSLSDPNASIRQLAVQYSAGFQDALLQKAILNLVHHEKNWEVRVEAIGACGSMQIFEAKEDLFALLKDDKRDEEEKLAAVISLATLLKNLDEKEISFLARHKKREMRLLSCYLVSDIEKSKALDLILPLLNDPNPSIRSQALQTLMLLDISQEEKKRLHSHIKPLLQDVDPTVAIVASWATIFIEPKEGQDNFIRFLNDSREPIRLFAASALAATGKQGLPLLEKTFIEAKDPLVAINLALELIGQRINVQAAEEALWQGLKKETRQLMWQKEGVFRALVPSTVSFHPLIPNYPETINQMTRLEIIAILAILRSPHAEEEIRKFLNTKVWEITANASFLLLSEGTFGASELIDKLLEDSDPQIRIHTALLLAFLGQGEKVASILQNSYQEANRELKERILEGIGSTPLHESASFLVERFQESYPMLRVIAASSLLKSIYN